MLAVILLILGILSRFIIHLPNFTPVIAIALFGGVYLKKKQAIVLPLALYLVSDIFLGFHRTMMFTWMSILLIVAIGFWLKQNKNTKSIIGSSILAAVLYYIVTNFGVWLVSGIYPLTMAGLTDCFVRAIPYFRNTLVSTLIYIFVLFWAYEVIASRVKNTRLANVLLTS